MQFLKNVMYDKMPDDITVYPSYVDVLQSAREIKVEEVIEDGIAKAILTKYECDIKRYTTSEYYAEKE